MIDTNVFPKGTYIVLLSNCLGDQFWRDSMPDNHIYKLTEDSSTFMLSIERDINNTKNGWSIKPESAGMYNKMKLRAATEQEIAAYKEYGPCHISKASFNIVQYEIY